jgi:hypothetical protein
MRVKERWRVWTVTDTGAREPESEKDGLQCAMNPQNEGHGRHYGYEARKWGRWLPLPLKSRKVREMTATGSRNIEIEGDDRHWH